MQWHLSLALLHLTGYQRSLLKCWKDAIVEFQFPSLLYQYNVKLGQLKIYKYWHNYRRKYSDKDIPGDGCDIEGGFGKWQMVISSSQLGGIPLHMPQCERYHRNHHHHHLLYIKRYITLPSPYFVYCIHHHHCLSFWLRPNMSVQPEGEPDMWALVEKSGACQSSCQDRSRDHFQPVFPKKDVDSQMLILPQICIYWRRNFDAEMVFAQSERGVSHRELLTHHPRYKNSHLFKYLSDVATKYIETILNKLVLAIYTIWLNIDNITTQCMATLGERARSWMVE